MCGPARGQDDVRDARQVRQADADDALVDRMVERLAFGVDHRAQHVAHAPSAISSSIVTSDGSPSRISSERFDRSPAAIAIASTAAQFLQHLAEHVELHDRVAAFAADPHKAAR